MHRGRCLLCGHTYIAPNLDQANRMFTAHYRDNHDTAPGRRYGHPEGEGSHATESDRPATDREEHRR
jgi:hypothetical protein